MNDRPMGQGVGLERGIFIKRAKGFPNYIQYIRSKSGGFLLGT